MYVAQLLFGKSIFSMYNSVHLYLVAGRVINFKDEFNYN